MRLALGFDAAKTVPLVLLSPSTACSATNCCCCYCWIYLTVCREREKRQTASRGGPSADRQPSGGRHGAARRRCIVGARSGRVRCICTTLEKSFALRVDRPRRQRQRRRRCRRKYAQRATCSYGLCLWSISSPSRLCSSRFQVLISIIVITT